MIDIYDNVRKKYGKIGVYRLVVKSRISENIALEMDDTPENIANLQNIAKELGMTINTEVVKKRRHILSRLLRRKK